MNTQSEMQKVVFVGQTPSKFTGNGNMLQVCLDQVDRTQYDVFVLMYGAPSIDGLREPYKDPYNCGFPFFYLTNLNNDPQDWGNQQILDFLELYEVDQLIFIGIDIWRYIPIFSKIKELSNRKHFIWKVLVPYDISTLRQDWLQWFKEPDQVYVYSKFGYSCLKESLDFCEYFRPKLRYENYLIPATYEEKLEIRKALFPDATEETTIVGFIGNNQTRKNIHRMLKAISMVSKSVSDMIFYMHMDSTSGTYDIEMLSIEYGIPKGMVRHNSGFRRLFPEELLSVCKSFDVYLLPSIQEGLSWTVLEMCLLGIPPIISSSTAHLDYKDCEVIKELMVEPTENATIKLPTSRGITQVPVMACAPLEIAQSLIHFIDVKREDPERIKIMSEQVRNYGKKWAYKCNNISTILENNYVKKPVINILTKIGEIL